MPPAKENTNRTFMANLVAGGSAGLAESCICHPLDTIKTRMQLQRNRGASIGPFGTAKKIIQIEGVMALYKGLTAVVSGIVPKMAIRFSSFEAFKSAMASADGTVSRSRVFLAGTLAGVTEAVLVVTPMEVVKIRLQAQRHSLADPHDAPRYRGSIHAAAMIIKEEGLSALYKGVIPTVLRQATNQAVNFTAYREIKETWLRYSPEKKELESWQHLLVGGVSGAMGPLANSPIDVIKTRLQKQRTIPGETPKYNGVSGTIQTMLKEEGIRSFYKGLTPRLMRIVPGQAITFAVYERVSTFLAVNNLLQKQPKEVLPELSRRAKEQGATATTEAAPAASTGA
ncbi:succinate:fumarate antiporter [Capsaspora owczarzaki ATCC 30864]|uniref:Succinate:fumarate antiporter n=1 Tax=Capsaspora owczarzaki (strain ATCC 30864) TaxID=595528 RepID=A0A0D2WT06_CAPO3|nr:succinate:fumarate antiporter [Capsaspora owczarzaki ATCC 30864]KJE94663.1 succinate:fumarate antiporter [Capsaspora owczarzaki ATCC 30864]|eukprot:XP_004346961.1 succinate:fumarate antiporter [Capsaspora owczarzaki ATCC 30864]